LPRSVADAEEIPPALTLAKLERMALLNNPTLAQAGARIEAARGQWLQVGLKPNPHVGYQGEEIGNEGAEGMHGLMVSQEIITNDKLCLSRMVAQQEIARAEQMYLVQEQRVLTDVRQRYFAALVAQQAIHVSQDLADVSRKGVETAESLLNAREVARIDLLQARVIYNTARIRQGQAQARLVEAWRRLEAAVGSAGLSPVRLAGDPTADLPRLGWASSLERLWRESPELAAASADVERTRWQLEREAAQRHPNITIQAAAMYDTATNDAFANIGFSLPIPIHDANQGNIGRASAEVAAAEMNVERLRLSLRNRLAQAFGNYDAARREFDLYDREILPDARQSLEIVRGGYPAEFDYLKLITAQREYFQAELGRLDALQMLQSEAMLIEGMLLDNSLEMQP
jgi:cobalt-zinc-cadmium efflux system outer membrane protein